jgi:hypothetical protein
LGYRAERQARQEEAATVKKPHYLVIVFLVSLLVSNFCAAEVRAQDPDWHVLDEVRVTYYGDPPYTGGEIMASGVRYMKDNDTVALGPYHLQMVRDYYDAQQTFRWWWLPGWKLRHSAPAACYPVMASLNARMRRDGRRRKTVQMAARGRYRSA